MKYAWLLALAATGCFPTRSQEFTCSTTADCSDNRVCDQGFCVLGSRVPPDGDNGCMMITSPHVMFCDIPDPGPALDLASPGTYTYDTDSAALVDPSGGTVGPPPNKLVGTTQVISIQSLDVHAGATLRVIGLHPLLVASWSTITVDGVIDASSRFPATPADLRTQTGAGSNPTDCGTHAATAGSDGGNNAGGGGGGGGFGGAGGQGGRGNSNANSRGAAGVAAAAPSTVIGGCDGGKGGDGDNPGGPAGAGGGAIQLVAATSISITGSVTAGGSGGGPAVDLNGNNNDRGGGGGAGSGGLIGLDAPTITVAASAILAANGGGGGAGTNGNGPGTPVTQGQDGAPSATAAQGGTTPGQGLGGDGSVSAAVAAQNGTDSQMAGGGGAGGGVGFIIVHGAATVTPGATVSPAQTAM